MRVRRAVLAPAAVGLGLALGACGSTGAHHGRSGLPTTVRTATVNGTVTTTTGPDTEAVAAESPQAAAQTRANIGHRSAGEIVLDGFTQGSLSQHAYQDYGSEGGSEQVSIENNSAGVAFDGLCEGNDDIVDSSSPISTAELQLCQEHGVTPVQFQVGSDAVVLATENETDVGADCLTLAQVQAIFKAGSPIENWDQLGFDDVPLSTAGPTPTTLDFAFFGPLLVGATNPTLSDFRFDYHAEPAEDQVKGYVIGVEAAGELASAGLPALRGEVTSLGHLIAGWQATLRGAEAYVRSATLQDNDIALDAATTKRDRAESALRSLAAELASARATISQDRQTEVAAKAVLGRLGVFEFGYYTLYEEQLRPLEITTAADPENCVFPSQDTITSGTYPLARQLLLTVSLQELRSDTGLRDFLLSYLKNASRLTTSAAFVPLPNNVLVQEEDWLTGTKAPRPVTSPGSTSSVPTASSPGGSATNGGPSASTGATGTGGSTSGSLVPQGVH